MIEELVRKEVSWLAKQEAKTLNKMLRVYQDTFLELEEKLKPFEGKNTYTARQLRATHAQIGAVMEGMREQHSDLLGKQVRTVFNQQIPRDKKAWQKLEQVFGDPATAKQFGDFKPLIPQEPLKALLNTQDISIKGFNDQLTKQVRAAIAQGMAQGEGAKELTRRLAPFKSSARNKTHLHLIVRMETARSSNLAKIETIKQLQREFPDREYWLQVKDKVDKSKDTRNHWLSWAISGTVACITRKEYFEVTKADLDAAKAEYKKITGKKASDSGVLWKLGGVGRRGKTLPAHFWDRGVLVPWDPSWDTGIFGVAKHPQGSLEDPSKTPEENNEVRSGPDLPGSDNTPSKPESPTGSLRGLSGAEVRAQMSEESQVVLAIQKTFDAEQQKRDDAIKKYTKKKSLTITEKQKYNDLLKNERQSIKEHLSLLEERGKTYRAAMLEPGPSRISLSFGNEVSEQLKVRVDKVATEFSQMLGNRLPEKNLNVKQHNKGPQFIRPDIIALGPYVQPKLIAHELAHFFESFDKIALQSSLKFLDNRVRNEKFERLIDLTSLGKFTSTEWTRKDHFSDPYSGKAYYFTRRGETERSLPLFEGELTIGSEILATGFEQMYQNPALFAVQDPEFFDFIWEIMHG